MFNFIPVYVFISYCIKNKEICSIPYKSFRFIKHVAIPIGTVEHTQGLYEVRSKTIKVVDCSPH